MTNHGAKIWISGDESFPIVHLSDGASREVRIAPSAGFNAFSFRVLHRGQSVPILIEPEDDAELHRGGFAFGYPLLFPFPHRTRQGTYTFEGRQHQLDINWKDGNAIHGLVCDRPWKIAESGADNERGAWITATFDTRDFPEVQRQYPFDCIVTATYTLQDEVLTLDFSAQNVGHGNLPMGFGIHPWFPCPITENGERGACKLELPAHQRWEMESSTQLLPTGATSPVEGSEYDFRQPRALGEQFLDEVYTGLDFGGDWHTSRFYDEKSGLTIQVQSSCSFREFVVYAPLDRSVICLEPYSNTSDSANMHAQGVESGMTILAPQQIWSGTIKLSAVSL